MRGDFILSMIIAAPIEIVLVPLCADVVYDVEVGYEIRPWNNLKKCSKYC
jgi:hypothetical protein